MLLRREDAHPSRRFFYCLRNSRQNRFALCLGKPLHTFPGIAPVCAIPGKTASRFAWENRFTLFLELL